MRLCFARSTLDRTNDSSMVDATRLIMAEASSGSPGGIPALKGNASRSAPLVPAGVGSASNSVELEAME